MTTTKSISSTFSPTGTTRIHQLFIERKGVQMMKWEILVWEVAQYHRVMIYVFGSSRQIRANDFVRRNLLSLVFIARIFQWLMVNDHFICRVSSLFEVF